MVNTDERQGESGAAFKEAYASLNAAQKQAVDTIDGPVMVIAGPGTGKTQILTLRIANILLQTDTQPEQILALTFTDAGAAAMRERLKRFVGNAAYRVPIKTFHSLCGDLIQQYPDAYSRIVGGRPIRDLERVTLLEEILASDSIRKLRPSGKPTFYVKPLLSALQTMKREYVSIDDLATHNASLQQQLDVTPQYHESGAHKGKVRGEYTKLQATLEKNQELLQVYRLYEAMLADTNRFDFDDMIIETIRALEKDEGMLRDLQERYQYLLADEHQDVNASQNRLLELLASYHERPNIFVVGDEKQAIYRFQGASLENFLYFEDSFPETTTIALTENYRSSQTILDAAHELITAEANELVAELRIPLTAATAAGGRVTQHTFRHQALEEDWLVTAITTEIEAGIDPADIAVIVRKNKEVERVADRLRKAGISVAPSAESDILEHPITLQIRNLIRAIVRPEDEQALFTLLHGSYWNIPTADLVRVLRSRSFQTPLVDLLADTEQLQTLGVQDVSALTRVREVCESARVSMSSQAPQRVIEQAVIESGLKDYLLQHDLVESSRVLRRLLDEIEQMVVITPGLTLSEVEQNFTALAEHGIGLQAPLVGGTEAAVSIMTAHKSKGLEFHTVFAPYLTDRNWGGRTAPQYFSLPLLQHIATDSIDPLDDERRLLYVLLTRAKRTLAVSYAATNSEGTAFTSSRLLETVSPSLVHPQEHEEPFDPLAAIGTVSTAVSLSPALLVELFTARGFSATSLNNYLQSPYTYLYRNILRIPETQSLSLLFGTAVHAVIERLERSCSDPDMEVSVTTLTEMISTELGKLPLATTEYTTLHERALAALVPYAAHLRTNMGATVQSEYTVTASLPTGLPACPEVRLTGKLDRLDFDTSGTVVQVVDYKTGAPKTRNVIEGKTKTSNGDYKRQLVFYALLLSLHENEQFHCRRGVLSFVEPDKHGVIKEEVFDITEAEIAELKDTIVAAATEFVSGTFLDTLCDPNTSDYCHLWEALQRP